MQAHAHLKLIVSPSAPPAEQEPTGDRVSTVQPLGRARLRRRWLERHGPVLATWAGSAALVTLAALLALGWL